MNKKNNRRFRQTEIRMEAAMLDLMEQAGPGRITVTGICRRAQVDRSTFYAHFTDVSDMLAQMEVTLGDELLARYPPTTPSGQGERKVFSADSLIPFLTHIKEHRHFYRVILATRKVFPIDRGLGPLLDEVIRPRCLQVGITDEEEIIYYLIYFEAGLAMTLRHWVETDCHMGEAGLAATIESCIPAVLHG